MREYALAGWALASSLIRPYFNFLTALGARIQLGYGSQILVYTRTFEIDFDFHHVFLLTSNGPNYGCPFPFQRITGLSQILSGLKNSV